MVQSDLVTWILICVWFQVTQNNLKGAAETVRCAKSLDIRITVDYLQLYAQARTVEAETKQNTLAFKLRNFFSRK